VVPEVDGRRQLAVAASPDLLAQEDVAGEVEAELGRDPDERR
jgi:hypothetical protein